MMQLQQYHDTERNRPPWKLSLPRSVASSQSSVEVAVDVGRYAILELHARNDDD